MPATRLSAEPVSSPLASAFSISRGSKTSAETIRVTLQSQNGTGRGECVPYARYGESLESVLAQIESVRTEMEQGINCEALLDALPAGAARCALDCALWDLEAKISGVPVWKRAGLPEPKPLATAVTISLDTSEAMAQAARQVKGQILKLKLGGAHDIEKLKAVRTARPDARLILDANEGFSEESFPDLAHSARKLGVVMIEQPFPVGQDEPLERTASPVSVCADESAHTSEGLEALARRYDAVNIKLDKTGGLTEAIRMLKEARRYGFGIMIGCMVAGSLSMAPAFLLAGLADLVDLDGPIWLKEDIENGLRYAEGQAHPPTPDLWG